MRQVSYVLVGNGRLFFHLSHYFSILGICFIHWHRGLKYSFADWYAENLDYFQCKKILLCISDKAIEPFILAHPLIPQNKWVHFSGALSTDLAIGIHPLGSFGSAYYPDAWYKQLSFVLDSDKYPFSSIFPDLPNNYFIISAGKKALYHSLCVLSNNFSCILWEKFFSSLESEFAIPREMATIFLQQTFFNIQCLGKKALTGPLSRGDTITVSNNIAALEGDHFQGVYKAFVKIFESSG